MPRSEQYTEPAVKRQEWGRRSDDGPPALRLWAVCLCGLKVVIPAFYALQDTKTPVRIGDCAMLLNIVLSVALMRPLHHGGLA
jgi:putative peptidoglycan lipid II flippase